MTGSSDSVLFPVQPSRARSLPVAARRWRRPGVFTPCSPGCGHTARPQNRVRSNPPRPNTPSQGEWPREEGRRLPQVFWRVSGHVRLASSPRPRSQGQSPPPAPSSRGSRAASDAAHLRPRRSPRRTRPAARYSRSPRSGRGCTGSAGPRSAP